MTKVIEIDQLRRTNPLIWAEQGNIEIDSDNTNIFLGGGIATKIAISQAVPFDLLGFILTAEQVRRELNSDVHMLIADQHAWLANNLDQTQAEISAHNLHRVSQKIIKQFELTNWHIQLASEIFPKALPGSYEALETRDINHFAGHFNCGVKLGWTFSPNEVGHTDESHFDTLHNLPTILIKPGVTLDNLKPHESPYICSDPATRIVLDNGQDISSMLADDNHRSNTVSNHLRSICLLFANIVQSFPPKTPLATKISSIISLINHKKEIWQI